MWKNSFHGVLEKPFTLKSSQCDQFCCGVPEGTTDQADIWHSHQTKYVDEMSTIKSRWQNLAIQGFAMLGFAIGPASYVRNGSDLRPVCQSPVVTICVNMLTTLIPAINVCTRHAEYWPALLTGTSKQSDP